MEEVDQQGHPPGFFVLAPVFSQKQGEQKDHAQGEEQVHAVVAGPVEAPEPECLQAHAQEGQDEARGGGPAAPPEPRRPQQKKEGGEEQAVPGVGEHQKNAVIQGFQHRGSDCKAIIAVTTHAHQIEEPGQGQGCGGGEPGQIPRDHHSQEDRRKVPKVVQRAVQQQLLEPLEGGGEAPVVPVQGQVEDHHQGVHQGGLFQKFPRVRPISLGEKIPADHEEEGDGHPGQHPGEPEVRPRREGVQRGGVVAHHQKGGEQAEPVQSGGETLSAHSPPSHRVRMNPPWLSPEICQQPSGTSV